VLKRLESNGRHLLGLINDVLDLSKIEAGQLVLELSDYALEDIAQTVRSTLEPLAADKKLAFKIEVAPKLPPGHGDGRRLTQVVINLVGNAIKFTDTGEVVIKATATDGAFHLSVCDTGPGISAANQAKLFDSVEEEESAEAGEEQDVCAGASGHGDFRLQILDCRFQISDFRLKAISDGFNLQSEINNLQSRVIVRKVRGLAGELLHALLRPAGHRGNIRWRTRGHRLRSVPRSPRPCDDDARNNSGCRR